MPSEHRLTALRYEHQHNKVISAPSVAQMLGNTLYYRRFFPYYTFNVLGGLDSEGKGCVFTYDAIGSFERVSYAAQGCGQKLMIPLLDNLVGHKNRHDPKVEVDKDEALSIIKDAFITAGEVRFSLPNPSLVSHTSTARHLHWRLCRTVHHDTGWN